MALPVTTAGQAAVRAQLDKVLASRYFHSAEALSRLLRYTVERALEGRGGELKEYLVGVEVFGRGESFDPRVDSIVRVEASRLRARLADYYRSDGRSDAICIELPRGGYLPVFVAARRSRRRALTAAAVFLVAAGAALGWWALRHGRPVETARPSLAVLPFVNLGPDKEGEYFSDGITEEVISALGRIPGLRVVGRSSSFQFKGKSPDVREVAGKLRVSSVLEGSVRRTGDRLRVTAQLINTTDGYQIWSETYEQTAQDVFAIQDDIARSIATALRRQFPPTSRIRRTPDPEAHNLVLKARSAKLNRATVGSVLAGLQEAVSRDPNYAAAWVTLADTWLRVGLAAEEPPHDVMEKAREAIRIAERLDPDLPNVHVVLAMLKWKYDWDWPGAEREFRRASELEPSAASSRALFASFFSIMGRAREALDQIEQIKELDSLDPGLRSLQAETYYFARQYDRVVEFSRSILAGDPSARPLYYWLGRAYLSQNNVPQALETLEKYHQSDPTSQEAKGFGPMASVYAAAGRRADVQKLLDEALARAARRYVSPANIAQVYVSLGDGGHALDWLEKAFADRDYTVTTLKVEPIWDPLRSQPRFQSLLHRLKL